MASRIKYVAPVDSMSGMFGNRKNEVSQKGIIACVRRAKSATNDGYPYGYFAVRTKDGARTQNMINWNETFAEIVAATRDRMIDPAYIAADQAAFVKQTKYKTLYQFVFNICKEEILNGK